MIEVIEWINNGEATGTFSPYIIKGKEKPIMIAKDGRPLIFYSRKDARRFANDWLIEQKCKP
jgi:hypothetical protein